MKPTILGLPANQSLSAEDCYHIGRIAYLEKDYYHCVLWMKETSAKEEHSYSYFSKFDVLDHLSYCYAQVRFINVLLVRNND